MVYLVGAGPGDPGLITVKGMDCVRKADVIVYDRLVHPALIAEKRPDAEVIYVGKAAGAHSMSQDEINRLLIEKARQGMLVVRLKGGDPFVFGRGGEEAEALAEAGVEFEIVPGITSAIAAPAYAGIPVTHRGLCSALGIVTGHEDPTKARSDIKWSSIATGLDTIVFLMGVENLPKIVAELVKNGRDPSTPVAVVRWGTRSEQQTVTGTLANIVDKATEAGISAPAVTVVGNVVNLREKLRWFDNKPLFGKKVLVTRSRDQAGVLSEALREQGAEPIEFPVIRICPPSSFDEVDAALDRVAEYDWLLFTSANGVGSVIDRLAELGRDVRSLAGPKIGAIGPATADSLARLGLKVDYVPSKFVAEAVVDEFPENPVGKRILILRAEEAREILPERLAELGASVDVVAVYRTDIESSDTVRVKEMLSSGEIDIITFTSSSTVANFVKLIGESGAVCLPDKVKIACIGPITARAVEECGLRPDIVAEEYTIRGLVAAIRVALSA
ncbi:MAG: uroporphyrinogen-III C-methyltransferase [Armatimonadetes bacterium]|nr:uroporphyrinogen-III C-methyltransferase [Armatimonadota bacterium]